MANALQAVLDKAAKGILDEPRAQARPARSGRTRVGATASGTTPAPETKSAPASVAASAPAAAEAASRRPVRDGKRFVGAHVEPEVARQLKMIAAEDDTTIQDLIEEALDLLFAKKGKATLTALARRAG